MTDGYPGSAPVNLVLSLLLAAFGLAIIAWVTWRWPRRGSEHAQGRAFFLYHQGARKRDTAVEIPLGGQRQVEPELDRDAPVAEMPPHHRHTPPDAPID